MNFSYLRSKIREDKKLLGLLLKEETFLRRLGIIEEVPRLLRSRLRECDRKRDRGFGLSEMESMEKYQKYL